jgi:hypothetical protein
MHSVGFPLGLTMDVMRVLCLSDYLQKSLLSLPLPNGRFLFGKMNI